MINFLFISAFRFVLHFLHGFLAFAILYFLSSFWLPYCKVNQNFVAPQQGVVIYIESNGVHTDFLLPARSEEMDWFTCFPTTDFRMWMLVMIICQLGGVTVVFIFIRLPGPILNFLPHSKQLLHSIQLLCM
jgi:hypothetical protein